MGITGVVLTGGTQYFMEVGPTVSNDSTHNGWMDNTQGVTTPHAVASLNGGAWQDAGLRTQAAFDVLGTPAASVSEPATVLLLGSALAGLFFARWRKAR